MNGVELRREAEHYWSTVKSRRGGKTVCVRCVYVAGRAGQDSEADKVRTCVLAVPWRCPEWSAVDPTGGV